MVIWINTKGFSGLIKIHLSMPSSKPLAWRNHQKYLFLIFFFLGESSSEPFLPLPLDPRFSLSPRDSPSVENIYIYWMCINLFCSVFQWKPFSDPTYFSLLFPLYFHSRSLPVSPLARSQTSPDLHPVCGYVCPPAVKRTKVRTSPCVWFHLQIRNLLYKKYLYI